MGKPIVAIVGKPNVGKSSFFNYIVGKRISIVEDTPGVTRDRIYAETEWRGLEFVLIDTGGIELDDTNVFAEQMREQANMAIQMADVILFMTDIRQGITAVDKEIAFMLKKSKQPIVLVCNKADNYEKDQHEVYEFYNLGIGTPFPVSSTNAIGIGDVLDEIYNHIKDKKDETDDNEIIKVALIGKPNVGKSSLLNRILGQNRSIVSEVAGTTRDAIDSFYQNESGQYIFIDTAGIRKKSKVKESIEKYSVMRTLLAIERADVCLLLIKWDCIEKDNQTTQKFKKDVYQKLAYLNYAPIIFISAKTGQRVHKLFDLINHVANQNAMRVSTATINEVINEAIAITQPPTDKGKRLKIQYATQVSTKPPTFVIFVNDKNLFHFSYQRYIINQIRNTFGLEGTPVRLIIREKNKN